jgi:hypothetical protein
MGATSLAKVAALFDDWAAATIGVASTAATDNRAMPLITPACLTVMKTSRARDAGPRRDAVAPYILLRSRGVNERFEPLPQ